MVVSMVQFMKIMALNPYVAIPDLCKLFVVTKLEEVGVATDPYRMVVRVL